MCTSGLDAPSIFTTEELNAHFSSISSDPSALSVSEFLEDVAGGDYFPNFLFFAVTLSEVKLPKLEVVMVYLRVSSAFPTIGEFILDIFDKSIWELVFPSIWKKSLVIALNNIATPRFLSDLRSIALLCF